MRVILLERIRHFGELGEQVEVKAGYGRNYLLPKGKAIIANAENLKVFESRKAELENKAKEKLEAAKKRAEKLDNLELIVNARVSEDNKLYGSIGTAEIIEAINSLGMEAEKQEIQLPNGAFRATGDFEVQIVLFEDVSATIKLKIVPVA